MSSNREIFINSSVGGNRIAIIDNNDFFDFKNANFDFRTTAIADESKNFLDKVGLWKKIKAI